MGQKIRVAEVKPSRVDKQPTVIIDSDGTQMSGFQSGLKDLASGDLISVELKAKGKFLNIVSFEVLEKASRGSSSPEEAQQDADSPERRKSNEDQTRATIIAGLWQAGKLSDSDEEVTKLRSWLRQLGSGVQAPVAAISEPEKHESFIDMVWLREQVGILQKKSVSGFSNDELLQFIKKTYKVEAANVYEAVPLLDKGKATHFYNKVNDAIENN